jgi:hypothetical protein
MYTFISNTECCTRSRAFSGLWGSKYPAEYANTSPAQSFKSLINKRQGTIEHDSQPPTNDKECLFTCTKWLAREHHYTKHFWHLHIFFAGHLKANLKPGVRDSANFSNNKTNKRAACIFYIYTHFDSLPLFLWPVKVLDVCLWITVRLSAVVYVKRTALPDVQLLSYTR